MGKTLSALSLSLRNLRHERYRANHITTAFALLLSLFILLPGKSAFAASVTVSVQQANSKAPAQTITCAVLQQNCSIPLTINTGQSNAQSLNVKIFYISGSAELAFQGGNGNLYVGDTGNTTGSYSMVWVKLVKNNGPTSYQVALAVAPAQRESMALSNMIQGTLKSSPIATLNITLMPAP